MNHVHPSGRCMYMTIHNFETIILKLARDKNFGTTTKLIETGYDRSIISPSLHITIF